MADRNSFSFKLTPGKDDDLIAWLQSMPKGERSAAIKSRLRSEVSQEQVPGLDIIRSEIAQLREMISRGAWQTVEAPQVEAGPRLSADQIELRAQKMKTAKW